MDQKPFLKSKTFWFNVLALVGVIAAGFGFQDFEADAKVFEYGAAGITIINVVLRFLTNQGVKIGA